MHPEVLISKTVEGKNLSSGEWSELGSERWGYEYISVFSRGASWSYDNMTHDSYTFKMPSVVYLIILFFTIMVTLNGNIVE